MLEPGIDLASASGPQKVPQDARPSRAGGQRRGRARDLRVDDRAVGKIYERAEKGAQDMETKCGRFTAYLGHDDMAKVTFENCRDYRDKMIEEGKLSPRSISNHLKALKALFVYAFDNEP